MPVPIFKAPLIRAMERNAARGITCAGCDARCCTGRFNSMMLTAPEAMQIARALTETPRLRARLGEWKRRIRDAIVRWRLRAKGPRRTYDCPFLEDDRLCALPPAVKPIGCLSYNPDRLRRCDHDAEAFWKAHDATEEAWRRAGGERIGSVPIPVGVAWALGMEPAEGPGEAVRRAATPPANHVQGPIPEAEPLGMPASGR